MFNAFLRLCVTLWAVSTFLAHKHLPFRVIMEVIDGTESSFSVPTSLSELEDEGKDIFSTSIFNCSEPSIVLPDSSCYCLECTGTTCILCCKGTSPFCCTCHECSTCWNKNWSLITATQITVFLLFVFGIIFVMMMYFRTCKR